MLLDQRRNLRPLEVAGPAQRCGLELGIVDLQVGAGGEHGASQLGIAPFRGDVQRRCRIAWGQEGN